MGLLNIFEIISMNLQFIGILASIQNIWPDWKFIKYLAYLNLDLNINIPQIPRVDFRMQFIMLAYVLPLVITVMLLLSFKPMKVVIWYCCLLCSSALLTIGSLFYFLPQRNSNDTKESGLNLVKYGAIALGVLLLAFLFQRWKDDNDRRERLRVAPDDYVDEEDVSEFDLNWLKKNKTGIAKSFATQCRNSIIAFFLLYIGGVSSQLFTLSFLNQFFFYYVDFVTAIQEIPQIMGIIIFAVGLLFSYNWFSNLFQFGRDFNTKINSLIKKDFIKIILVLLGLVYIPTTTSLLSMTLCEPVNCPKRKELVRKLTASTGGDLNSIWSQFRHIKRSNCATLEPA